MMRKTTVHVLKLNSNFATAVFSGLKTFEIRKNDRGFQTGDRILFSVVDDNGRDVGHPLNNIPFEITYILSGWGIENGYVGLAIKKTKQSRKRG